MPLIMLKTNVDIPSDEKKNKLAGSLSAMLAKATGKPEAYVMAIVETGAAGVFAGKTGPLAFADVRGIGGLSREVNGKVMKGLADLLGAELDIPTASIYATFTDVAGTNWGWKDSTFA